MLNLREGKPLAMIASGKQKGEIIYLKADDKSGTNNIDLKGHTLMPIMNPDERSVCYIAGPSGSGKSTYSADLAKSYHKIHPSKDMYIFSRTDAKDDPAYRKIKALKQVKLDESIIEDPIDIAEIEGGSLLIFDDVNTILDKDIKDTVHRLMEDIMEVGRKMDISIIVTSHLINPNEKKFGRTILNEMQTFTFFPSSGSSYQIKYCLKVYFGLDNKKIDHIMGLPGRWVTVHKNYPMCVMYQNGAYLL